MLPLLRTVGLRVFSMASETYTPGSLSAAFVTCPNDTVARTLASSNHPYEVAEVISLPIEQGNPPYLKWIEGVVPE
ncbi:hypothetical protein JOQ06_012645 [Pogonophryne albipinna]|uniref:Uncharacterized protein n=1 Tax=Pogonophryne albipinna TaxID=1090488 RepID=A0AAD6BI36_9TELE|nr:hypothetical protein JOQ06_012645 [Pogonophryne albipinna]